MIVVPATSRSATTLVGHFELLVLAVIVHLLIGGLGSVSPPSRETVRWAGRRHHPRNPACGGGKCVDGRSVDLPMTAGGRRTAQKRAERDSRLGARTCVAKISFVRNARGPSFLSPESAQVTEGSAICARSRNGLGIATVGTRGTSVPKRRGRAHPT